MASDCVRPQLPVAAPHLSCDIAPVGKTEIGKECQQKKNKAYQKEDRKEFIKETKRRQSLTFRFFLWPDAAAVAGCCAQRRENNNQPEPTNWKRAKKVSALTKKINFVLEVCEVVETTHKHQLKTNLDVPLRYW